MGKNKTPSYWRRQASRAIQGLTYEIPDGRNGRCVMPAKENGGITADPNRRVECSGENLRICVNRPVSQQSIARDTLHKLKNGLPVAISAIETMCHQSLNQNSDIITKSKPKTDPFVQPSTNFELTVETCPEEPFCTHSAPINPVTDHKIVQVDSCVVIQDREKSNEVFEPRLITPKPQLDLKCTKTANTEDVIPSRAKTFRYSPYTPSCERPKKSCPAPVKQVISPPQKKPTPLKKIVQAPNRIKYIETIKKTSTSSISIRKKKPIDNPKEIS